MQKNGVYRPVAIKGSVHILEYFRAQEPAALARSLPDPTKRHDGARCHRRHADSSVRRESDHRCALLFSSSEIAFLDNTNGSLEWSSSVPIADAITIAKPKAATQKVGVLGYPDVGSSVLTFSVH